MNPNPHDAELHADDLEVSEHFKPSGTIFFLAIFVVVIVLLWASVYVILLSRGVTV